MKKAILTGATGFIGSYLIQELTKNNVDIYAVVMENDPNVSKLPSDVHITYCNLENLINLDQLIKERDFDCFYHLAWAGTAGPSRANYELQLQNIKYTCDAALVSKKLNAKKFLTTGTITENIAQNQFHSNAKSENLIYGIAKMTTRHILDVLCNKHQISYLWAQLSNIYGGNNTSGNIISYTLSELSSGRKPQYSKALQPYDLMYVEDVTRALYLLGFNNTLGTFYFIGSGKPRILREYLLSIKDIFGHGAEIGLGEKPEDGAVYEWKWFDTKALETEMGFKVSKEFEENMSHIIHVEMNIK
ncbi:MAG: NAD-dependent epimerase/dehydratase family protein [Acholeplasmataceae bacterium]|nr:NAD-dependent epimerase/dehydratase family protein [Acholeplasmataceae bacterium]